MPVGSNTPGAATLRGGFFVDFGFDLGGSWRGLVAKDGEIRGQTSDLRYNCDF